MRKISKVISRLAGKNIYFDTNPIIYFLNQTEGFFQLLAHNREVLEMTAEIRATQNLKMVDAIHATTAIHYQCGFIITAVKTIQKRIIVFNKGKLNGSNVIIPKGGHIKPMAIAGDKLQ